MVAVVAAAAADYYYYYFFEYPMEVQVYPVDPAWSVMMMMM